MVVAATETLSTLMHNNNENNNKIAMTNSHLDVEMSPTVNIDDLINSKDMLPLELSTIQKFYSGCNILITGGTGFLGKSE
jgi:FlaA1/EpsC-like NDP-sugar epimerase